VNKFGQLVDKLCPSGVPFVQLSSTVLLLNGYSFKSEKYSTDGVLVVRISNVQDGFLDFSDHKFYPEELEVDYKNYLLKQNDIVLSLTGNVGRVAMVDSITPKCALNQRVAAIRNIDEKVLNIRFLFHILKSDNFKYDCEEAANGSAQANLSTEWLKKYMIPLPPIEMQNNIVEILDTF